MLYDIHNHRNEKSTKSVRTQRSSKFHTIPLPQLLTSLSLLYFRSGLVKLCLHRICCSFVTTLCSDPLSWPRGQTHPWWTQIHLTAFYSQSLKLSKNQFQRAFRMRAPTSAATWCIYKNKEIEEPHTREGSRSVYISPGWVSCWWFGWMMPRSDSWTSEAHMEHLTDDWVGSLNPNFFLLVTCLMWRDWRRRKDRDRGQDERGG